MRSVVSRPSPTSAFARSNNAQPDASLLHRGEGVGDEVLLDIPMLDLRTEYANLKPDIDAAIARVIASGRFTLGPELLAFERAFAEYFGQEFAIGVGSGTSALHLSLRAAGIGPGDDVITAANTDVATTMAITQAGANVVLTGPYGADEPGIADPASLDAVPDGFSGTIMTDHIERIGPEVRRRWPTR